MYCLTLRAATVSLLFFFMHGAALAADDAAIQYAADGDQPIVTLSRDHGRIRGLTERPLLYIYADGRIHVDRPPYMVRPGRFSYRLPPEQLNQLLATFDRQGVLALDTNAVRAQHAAAAQAQRGTTQQRFITTDTTTTRIDFAFAYFGRGAGKPAPLSNSLRFSDLQIEAQRFAHLTQLNALAQAEKQLLTLLDHPDMQPRTGDDNER